MKKEEIDFLEEYKKICIKYKKQILGFDDGAYVVDLTDEEYELEALVFNEHYFPDGSIGHSYIHFARPTELKNSISGFKIYLSSSHSIKEEYGNRPLKVSKEK